jgi:hypothetical protein
MAGLCIVVGDRLPLLVDCCILVALFTELCDRLEALDETLDLDEPLELEADEEED